MSNYVLGPDVQIDSSLNLSVSAASQATSLTPKAPLHSSDEIRNDRDAAGFLQKTTFGPTVAEIASLVALGSKRAWLIDQFSRKLDRRYMDRGYVDMGISNLTIFSTTSETDTAILTTMLQDPAALRTRCTWSLAKLFIISQPGGAFDDPGQIYGFTSWFDRLDKFVFGNWRDLIESITYSVHMSRMLTYYANEKEGENRQPDENYARELMQLFTIGLYEMNLDGTPKLDQYGQRIPTYVNDDIRQVARCLTGLTRWDFNGSTQRYDLNDATSISMARSNFGNASSTTLFGNPDLRLKHYLPFYEYGAKSALGGKLNIPSGTGPVENLKILHDTLFNHPNAAPFFAMRMIRHHVTSNPSPAYVYRVSQAFEDNGAGVRGDMRAVWTAIFCDPEAANDGRLDPMFGRVRDGFDLWTSFARPFGRRNSVNRSTIGYNGDVYSFMGDFGPTAPRMSPSIFGPYDATHSPPDLLDREIFAPEMGQWSDVLLARAMNRLMTSVGTSEPRDTPSLLSNISDYSMLPVTGLAADLIERLNLLMCGGKMSPGLRASLQSLIGTMPVSTATEQQDRVAVALQMLVSSTDFWVQL